MMSPEERTYGGHTLEYWLPWLEETVAKVVQPGSQTTALLEAMQHIKALRAERPSSEELAAPAAPRERETQQSIGEWAYQAFGPAPNVARVAARANEEMSELLRAVTSDATVIEPIAEECADIVIILLRLAHIERFDLMAEVDKKMAINRKREWKRDNTGHGYHVRALAPSTSGGK